jgi:4-amino-4-deoxy-L-arabinose transferase-like glycosyltransferase
MLAAQMIQAPGIYNTIPIYEDSLKKGRELPPYFKMPLFKHPPMFSWLIKQSYGFFGMNYYAGFRVSLLMGVLLIALAYFLGSTLFGEKTGLIAAAIMFIEPVSWIASQKIWMETTLAFFMVLSLCLFAMTIRKYNPYLMIASGVAAGLAALCKYPGLLATAVIVVYAVLSDRVLFRKKAFWGAILMPFLILLPWIAWNQKVYGMEIFNISEELVRIRDKMGFLVEKTWWMIPAAGAAVGIWFAFRGKITVLYERSKTPVMAVLLWIISSLAVVALLFAIRGSIVNASVWEYIPEAGWRMGMFANAPWHFYLGRLVELSPFYLLSFLGFLLFAADKEKRKEYVFLYVASFLILGLYILWGNYQCRYITAVTVPLIALSARTQVFLYEKAKAANPAVKYTVLVILAVFVLFAASRTLNMDQILAVPNNVCYF